MVESLLFKNLELKFWKDEILYLIRKTHYNEKGSVW